MLRISKKIAANILMHATALAAPVAALAAPAGTNQLVPQTIRPINNIINVVRGAVQFILVVAFVLAFIFLIIGGVRWIVAGGDEKGVAGARGMITAALIGLVIVLVAFAIIRLVEVFFNVDIISNGVSVPNIYQQ